MSYSWMMAALPNGTRKAHSDYHVPLGAVVFTGDMDVVMQEHCPTLYNLFYQNTTHHVIEHTDERLRQSVSEVDGLLNKYRTQGRLRKLIDDSEHSKIEKLRRVMLRSMSRKERLTVDKTVRTPSRWI